MMLILKKKLKESANSDINEDSEESSLLADVLSDDSLSTDSLSTDLSFEEFATENPLYAVYF